MKVVVLMCLLTQLHTSDSSDDMVCQNNETSYNITQTVNSSTVIPEIRTRTTTHTPDCSGFIGFLKEWFTKKCESTTWTITYLAHVPTLYETTELVTRCCPGHVLQNDTCIPGTGCSTGKYGENCTSNCACPDHAYQQCDMITGNCTCLPGHHGPDCNETCSLGFYGSDCIHECTCENNSTCDVLSGDCNCTAPGWSGISCRDECVDGAYGVNCEEICTCNENQTCHHVSGNCTCKAGYSGINCTQACSKWAYNVNCISNCTCNTSNAESCDRISGHCTCKAGYIGTKCDQECAFGFYGDRCARNCTDHCEGTNYCDPVNGTCICLGKQGTNCSEDCEAGQFGIDCKDTCNCSNSYNNTCDPYNGTCYCLPGWLGDTCKVWQNTTTASITNTTAGVVEMTTAAEVLEFIEQNKIIFIAGGGGAAVLVFLVVIVGCCCYHRKGRTRAKEKRESNISNMKENPSYDCEKLENGLNETVNLKEDQSEEINKNNEKRLSPNGDTGTEYDVDTTITHTNSISAKPDTSNVHKEEKVETVNESNVPDRTKSVKSNETSSSSMYPYTSPTLDTEKDTHRDEEDENYDVAENITNAQDDDTSDNDSLYDETCTSGNRINKQNKTVNTYATFDAVRKLQHLESGEEDYDVLENNKPPVDRPIVEAYSNFHLVKRTNVNTDYDNNCNSDNLYNRLGDPVKENRLANVDAYNKITLDNSGVIVNQSNPHVLGNESRSTSSSNANERRKQFKESKKRTKRIEPSSPSAVSSEKLSDVTQELSGNTTSSQDSDASKDTTIFQSRVEDIEEEYSFCEIEDNDEMPPAIMEDIYEECTPCDAENDNKPTETKSHNETTDQSAGVLIEAPVYEDVSEDENEHDIKDESDVVYDDVGNEHDRNADNKTGMKDENDSNFDDKALATSDTHSSDNGEVNSQKKTQQIDKELKTAKKSSVRRKEDYEEFELK